MVWYSEFGRRFPYDRCNFLIMHMADVCKQVMLYLEIQSADEPGKQAAIRSKISCISYFMYGP